MKFGAGGRCCHRAAPNQPLLKTLSFAVLHFFIAFTVAYLLTGSVLTGGLIALIEPACNTVAFYFHEKLWSRRSKASTESGYGHGNLADAFKKQPDTGCTETGCNSAEKS